ncbi:hypothetical protein DB354_02415 [Opitutus sp. ER46]|nr:hypothetical protein DB354_02415 [Opitutus sp. ER46]
MAAPRGVPDPMARVLAAFELDRTELFLVVNLFSVDPQPVRLSVLADQSGASIAEVREAFGHLDAQGVVSSPGTGRLRDDRDVMLTELGRDMTVYAVYRLVDVAKAL